MVQELSERWDHYKDPAAVAAVHTCGRVELEDSCPAVFGTVPGPADTESGVVVDIGRAGPEVVVDTARQAVGIVREVAGIARQVVDIEAQAEVDHKAFGSADRPSQNLLNVTGIRRHHALHVEGHIGKLRNARRM